jgi:hypothetical protein
VLKLSTTALMGDHTIGFQYAFGHKLKGRQSELPSFTNLLVRARTTNTKSLKAKLSLINQDAISFSTLIPFLISSQILTFL